MTAFPPKPHLHVTSYSVKGNALTLFGHRDGTPATRRVNLTRPGAGLDWWHPCGVGLIIRGQKTTPSYYPATQNTRIKLYHHHRPFVIAADVDLLKRMGADVWPLMKPGPDFAIEPIPTEPAA